MWALQRHYQAREEKDIPFCGTVVRTSKLKSRKKNILDKNGKNLEIKNRADEESDMYYRGL